MTLILAEKCWDKGIALRDFHGGKAVQMIFDPFTLTKVVVIGRFPAEFGQ